MPKTLYQWPSWSWVNAGGVSVGPTNHKDPYKGQLFGLNPDTPYFYRRPGRNRADSTHVLNPVG